MAYFETCGQGAWGPGGHSVCSTEGHPSVGLGWVFGSPGANRKRTREPKLGQNSQGVKTAWDHLGCLDGGAGADKVCRGRAGVLIRAEWDILSR